MPLEEIKKTLLKKIPEYGMIGVIVGALFYYFYTRHETERREDKDLIEYYRGKYNQCSESRFNDATTTLREATNTLRESNRIIRKYGRDEENN